MKDIQVIGKHILQELGKTIPFILNEHTQDLVQAILQARKIFVAGAGRSGLMSKAFGMRLMQMGFDVYAVGETVTPNVTDKDLLIIASGSGKTKSLVVIARKAKKLGASAALMTTDRHSPISQIVDIVIAIPAPSPKVQNGPGFTSIQPMGSLFEQSVLLFFDAIILVLMEKRQITTDAMFTRHANLE